MTPDARFLGRNNPLLSRLRRIVKRQEAELTVVDGLNLVREMLGLEIRFEELYAVGPHIKELIRLPGVRRLAQAGNLFEIDPETATRIAPSQHGQGVLAVVRVPQHTFALASSALFLDRVQDPGNLGGIVRTAAAFGVRLIICSPGCADPFSPRAIRASAGHTLRLPVLHSATFSAAASAYKRAGGRVSGTVGAGGTPLHSWTPAPPLLLVLGNEGQGLSAEILDRCTDRVTVPMSSTVESLNVAVSAGIILATLWVRPEFRSGLDIP